MQYAEKSSALANVKTLTCGSPPTLIGNYVYADFKGTNINKLVCNDANIEIKANSTYNVDEGEIINFVIEINGNPEITTVFIRSNDTESSFNIIYEFYSKRVFIPLKFNGSMESNGEYTIIALNSVAKKTFTFQLVVKFIEIPTTVGTTISTAKFTSETDNFQKLTATTVFKTIQNEKQTKNFTDNTQFTINITSSPSSPSFLQTSSKFDKSTSIKQTFKNFIQTTKNIDTNVNSTVNRSGTDSFPTIPSTKASNSHSDFNVTMMNLKTSKPDSFTRNNTSIKFTTNKGIPDNRTSTSSISSTTNLENNTHSTLIVSSTFNQLTSESPVASSQLPNEQVTAQTTMSTIHTTLKPFSQTTTTELHRKHTTDAENLSVSTVRLKDKTKHKGLSPTRYKLLLIIVAAICLFLVIMFVLYGSMLCYTGRDILPKNSDHFMADETHSGLSQKTSLTTLPGEQAEKNKFTMIEKENRDNTVQEENSVYVIDETQLSNSRNSFIQSSNSEILEEAL